MSVLTKLFNSKIDQSSPCQSDYIRKVKLDEDGNEYISYVEVDYPALVASLGNVEDWSLNSLLKAGINPDFPIHTGNPTRLEGIETVQEFSDYYDQLFADVEPSAEVSED